MAYFILDDRSKTDPRSIKRSEEIVYRAGEAHHAHRAAHTISTRRPEERRRAPIISDTGAVAVLESYTGLIEAVEGGHVFLTLYAEGEYYELELSDSVFGPGAPIEVGRGVEAKLIQRRDDTEAWTARVLPPEPIDFEELEEYREELARKFDGSGL